MTMQLAIDRSKWLRGVPGAGALYDGTSGKMCCLGFVCVELLEMEIDRIEDIGMPDAVHNIEVFDEHGLLVRPNIVDSRITCSSFAAKAANINDSDDYEDREDEREEELIKLFVANDICLTFYDGNTDASQNTHTAYVGDDARQGLDG